MTPTCPMCPSWPCTHSMDDAAAIAAFDSFKANPRGRGNRTERSSTPWYTEETSE